MDHETAVQLKATERYFLGELTGADRELFEEHFFICPDCAEDVRAMTVFAANAKAAFRADSASTIFLSGKTFWLSAALNVALLVGAGYGLLRFVPQMKQ